MPRRNLTGDEIEHRLDRDEEREPFAVRRRIPLHEAGAVRVFFFNLKKQEQR